MTKVGVILDWKRAQRGNAWELLLKEIDSNIEVTFYPIADLIVEPVKPPLQAQIMKRRAEAKGLQQINEEQVLILNWDAVNGDPEFGAHLSQRWLEHRRPEIIEWVRKGGILLIESQTTLGVPCSAAYEAAVGKGELATSGLEDPTQPMRSVKPRSGTSARKTARFPTGLGFGAVDQFVARNAYPEVRLFPKTTTGLLSDVLERSDSGTLLWRGVFRKTLRPYKRKFPWISIIETDVGTPYRQSIMRVAKVGDGAIFASTMMLALTGQHELVSAIIRCADGNTLHLPNPVTAIELVKSRAKLLLTLFGAVAAALVVRQAGPVVDRLAALFSFIGVSKSTVQYWVQLALVALGLGLVLAGYRIYLWLRKLLRDVMGY